MPNPTAKLASFLFKGRRLSQASLELSSSRGVFGSRESERNKREREKIKAKLKNKTLFTKAVNENLQNYLLHQKLVKTKLSLLQNERSLYRQPQGMEIPKNLATRLSYKTTM